MEHASRNDSLGFAQRTRENLEFIEKASNCGHHVHFVTQLINSLLGLIVFPWERQIVERTKDLHLDALAQQGWPQFEVITGKCETLYDLLNRLRNAAAHSWITFSSDSLRLDEVEITFEDRKTKKLPPHWCACFAAQDLRTLCLRFTALIDDTIG